MTMPSIALRRGILKSNSTSNSVISKTENSNSFIKNGEYIKFKDKNDKVFKIPMGNDSLKKCAAISPPEKKAKSTWTEQKAALIIQKAYRQHRKKSYQLSCMELMYRTSSAKSSNKNKNILKMFGKGQQISKFQISNITATAGSQYVSVTSLFQQEKETVLVFGGIDPHGTYGVGRNTGKDIFKYVPDDNSWEYVGDLPEPRYYHCVQFFKGRIFLVGGADPRDEDKTSSRVVDTVWSFEPVARCWYREANLIIPRKHFGLIVCNQFMFAVGGQSKQKVLKSVEKYNMMEACWEEVAPMLTPRTGLACAKYKDYIWAAGGLSGLKKNCLLDSVESYSTKTNQWTQITKLSFPRCFACLYVMQDSLYIFGGAGKSAQRPKCSVSLNVIDLWEPSCQKWRHVTEMSIPRHGHSITCLGTQLMIIGGVTTTYMRALSNTECFCCQRGAWVRGISCLPSALSGHAAVTLPPATYLP